MALYSKDDFYFVEMGAPLPPCCNGCSAPLPEPPGRFVFWAFVGPELTRQGKMITVGASPDDIEYAMTTEAIAERFGDASEGGPGIALCASCALGIGQCLIEDGAILRWVLNGEHRLFKTNPDEEP